MNALIATRSVRSVWAGITTGLGAMSADALLGAVVYGVHAVIDLGCAVRYVDALGAAVLAAMAVRIVRERPSAPAAPIPTLRVYSDALLVGVSNPFQILWWVTAGLAFAYVGGAPLFLGLFAAIAIWIVAFPWAIAEGARRDPRVPRIVAWGSAGALVLFAGYFALLAAGVPI